MTEELKTFTIEDIRSWGPCYDPVLHLPEGWSGTALTILENPEISISDKFWVVLREDLLSERLLRLFAVWCARQVQHLMTDQRSITALDVVEKFANGEASKEDLTAAARAAAWAAADAADAAAWAAADAAAAAAADAAWAAADAADAAAWAAAAAARAAADAADAAARAAADAAQLQMLIKMIKGEKR